jgi:hypothetical protein
MLKRMSSAEITEWQAYEQVTGPLGAERFDALFGLSSFYALKAAGVKKVKLEDVMPRWDRPKPQSWRSMQAVAKALAAAYGEVR